MTSKLLLGMAGALAVFGTPAAGWAGGHGHGIVFHVPGGMRGGAHVGFWGASRGLGQGHALMGQTRGDRFRFGGRGMVFGHVNTAAPNGFSHRSNGFGRLRPAARFALDRRRRFGFGAVGTGYGYGGYGGYGQGAAVPAYGTVYAPSDTGYGSYATGGGAYGPGYAEPPIDAGYAEPPLNQIGGGYGGPQIIVVGTPRRQRSETCGCGRADGPMVYRFGVGSYY